MSDDGKFWAVHVLGPDDVLAMPDRETADRKAAEINAFWAAYQQRPDARPDVDPKISAEIIEWPWSAPEHAACMVELIAEGEVPAMSEPIVLRIRPMAEAARYLLDRIDDLGSDAGRIIALTQIAEDLIAEIPAAEARGYDRAVANLRDRPAYEAWMKADMESDAPGVFWPYAEAGPRFADYLDSIKEQP